MKTTYTQGYWTYTNGAVYEQRAQHTATKDNPGALGARLLFADRQEPLTSPTERDRNLQLAAQAPGMLKMLQQILRGRPLTSHDLIVIRGIVGDATETDR